MLKEITATFAGDYHAFAVLTDTFEQAYVPNSVVSSISIEVGRTYRAGVVENRNDPKGQTPWFVTFIEGADFSMPDNLSDDVAYEVVKEDAAPVDPSQTVSKTVRAAITHFSGPFLASELAIFAGVENSDAGTVLNNMFTLGEVSCAKIYKTSGQARASQTIWCTDVRKLLK